MTNTWFHSAGYSAGLVSIERFVDDRIFATRSGAYGATFQLAGVDPECLSDTQLENVSARLLQALRVLPEDCSLYQILVKRRDCELDPSQYSESETERRRREHLATRNLSTVELYWTICIHSPKLAKRTTPVEQRAQSATMLRRLRGLITAVRLSLSDLSHLKALDCHAVVRLYGHIANLEPPLVRQRLSSHSHVDRQIARSSVSWHDDGLQIGKRHARLFSLIQRPSATRPNLFGGLLRLHADVVLVLELRRATPEATRKEVASQQRFKDFFKHSLVQILAHMRTSREVARSASSIAAEKGVDQLADIVNDLDNRGLNYAQFSLIGMLHSRDKGELDDQMAQVHRIVGRCEGAALEEGIGSLSAYWSLFPAAACGAQSTNVRRAWIREDHLANLSLIYSPYTGEPRSHTLEDEALAIFETRDGTPFYFDPYSNGVRGMLVVGATGRGKSFRLNLECDAQAKYGGFLFIFDVGGSYESTVLHHGGSIVRFGLRGPRLNPFALPPTDENIDFVYRLVRLLLTKSGAVLAPTQEVDLYQRVKAMYSLAPESRKLKHLVLAPQLQPYLHRWIEGGIYGRIFDNVEDELRFTRVVAFEFQEVAGEEHRDLMEPLLFWLRWQTQAITHDRANLGVPKLEIYDECWKHLKDPAMLAMMINTAKTARKHLGGIILATQDAGDLGEHASLIRNACSDTLFLGGPFNRETYRELFKLHDGQLDLIGSLRLGESLLVRADYSKVLITSVDDESAWRYTTRAKDRKRREEAIQQFGREHAFAHLAAGNGNHLLQGVTK